MTGIIVTPGFTSERPDDDLITKSSAINYLEVCIHSIKLLGVTGKLLTDVLRPDEDALQMGPSPLHLKPDGDDGICGGQLLLPSRYFFQEMCDVFGCH